MGCLGFRQMDFEQILWVDSSGASGWEPKEAYDCYGSLACRSAGFLANEDADTVTLVLSEADNGFNSSITIPKCAIVARKKVADSKSMNAWCERKMVEYVNRLIAGRAKKGK